MATSSLMTLPDELIAYITSFLNPSSVPAFSQTCRRIRELAYDHVVFKNMIAKSQRNLWKSDTLDIDAIVSRAGADATIWARYAVADERAWNFVQAKKSKTLDSVLDKPPKASAEGIDYVPELFAVKHPCIDHLIYWDGWSFAQVEAMNQVFCLALAGLACHRHMYSSAHILSRATYRTILQRISLRCVCVLAFRLRSVRPNGSHALPSALLNQALPIPVPKLHQISLRPANDRYHLPAPFSRPSKDLFGKPTSSFSDWDSWYRLHNAENFRSVSYLTESSWCGYYENLGQDAGRSNPPITDVDFYLEAPNTNSVLEEMGTEAKIIAKGCREGTASFDLLGTIELSDTRDEVVLNAMASHTDPQVNWRWDCRSTPFGIAGIMRSTETYGRYRIFWLWKTSWTQAT